MNKSSVLTQAQFDELLQWLDHDRERAGHKYENIRRAIIKVFAARRCYDAEELADETLNRVARKARELAPTYEGNPALFFYGVARNVHREYLKGLSSRPVSESAKIEDRSQFVAWATFDSKLEGSNDARLDCLTKCLRSLPDDQRELVTAYYEDDKGRKVDSRKALAQRNALSVNALRLKAHRLRQSLRRCVQQCVEITLRHESRVGTICV
ncbi:MAG: hypothetical protein JWM21_853 [Acidobacteria bacterium]|nr:hypothetical protein [Acidobacteriota bacterium]